jgi:hypothetical protein
MSLIALISACTARISSGLVFSVILFFGGTASTLAQQRPAIPPDTLFVMASFDKNGTRIFNSKYEQIAAIPQYGDEAVGRDGTLYIARTIGGGYTNTLTIFAPPYTKQTATLTYGGFAATGVATDPRAGIFAVTGDWAVSPFGGPSFVRFYKEGTTKQCNYVAFPPGYLDDGSAFDREGTFYSGRYGTKTTLVSISGGCKGRQFIIHDLPPGVTTNGGHNH